MPPQSIIRFRLVRQLKNKVYRLDKLNITTKGDEIMESLSTRRNLDCRTINSFLKVLIVHTTGDLFDFIPLAYCRKSEGKVK